MATAIKVLTEVQIGKESGRGTAVAATRRLLLTGASYRRQQSYQRFEDQMHGLLTGPAVGPKLTREHTELELQAPLGDRNFLLPLLAGVKGAVTPSTPGSGSARLWTFAPGVEADPSPDAYTFEFVERSAADRAEMEAPYGICSGWTITAGLEGVPELAMSFFARKTVDSTYTSGLSVATQSYSPNLRWGLYVDETWAGRGASQISAQVLGFTAQFSNFIRPAWYLDNRSDLDFTQYEFGLPGGRVLDLSVDLVHDPASARFVQTEEAKKTAGAKRFVRVQLIGSAFAAPDAGINRRVTIDMTCYHAADSMEERGQDQDGNLTVRAHLISAYDNTAALDMQIEVVNALTTFP